VVAAISAVSLEEVVCLYTGAAMDAVIVHIARMSWTAIHRPILTLRQNYPDVSHLLFFISLNLQR